MVHPDRHSSSVTCSCSCTFLYLALTFSRPNPTVLMQGKLFGSQHRTASPESKRSDFFVAPAGAGHSHFLTSITFDFLSSLLLSLSLLLLLLFLWKMSFLMVLSDVKGVLQDCKLTKAGFIADHELCTKLGSRLVLSFSRFRSVFSSITFPQSNCISLPPRAHCTHRYFISLSTHSHIRYVCVSVRADIRFSMLNFSIEL